MLAGASHSVERVQYARKNGETRASHLPESECGGFGNNNFGEKNFRRE
jgi:hypothetical protein